LLQALSQVAPVAGRNSQLPILQHVLLQVRENILHLTTTDLEVGVHSITGGKAKEDGSCTVPARRFFDYVQQVPSKNPLVLEKKNNGLIVSTKGFRAVFPLAEAEDFPLLPDITLEHTTGLEPGIFCRALEDVLFAASREDMRPEIRSVFVAAEGRNLRIAATDSFRLAEKIIPLTNEASFTFILPLPSAQEVVRLFSNQQELHVIPHPNHVAFQTDAVEFTSRLIDGQYPDYQQIIPRGAQTELKIERDELLRALKTLAVFLPKDSRRVQFEVDPDKGLIHLLVAGSEEGQVEVAIQEGKGEKLSVMLNIQYLLEGIQHVASKYCRLLLNGSEDPVVIKPQELEGSSVYLVMPIQV
jgi:DNA polymerase-3 subunit beta